MDLSIINSTYDIPISAEFWGRMDFTPNDTVSSNSMGAEQDETQLDSNITFYDDENVFEYVNPEEMLQPQAINAFFFPIIVTHSITFIIGLIGNSLTVAVMLGDKNSRNATNFFLVSLAISDLLLLLLCIPLETLQYFLVQWNKNGIFCLATRYVELLSASASVLNLCAVSLERFIVIVFPMRSRSLCTLSNCRKAILLVWIIAVFLAAPVFTEKSGYSVVYRNSQRNVSVTIFYCKEEDTEITLDLYKLIILFVAPGLLMMICYTYVIRELWRSTRNINLLTNTKRGPGKTLPATSRKHVPQSENQNSLTFGKNKKSGHKKSKGLRNGKDPSLLNGNKSTKFRNATVTAPSNFSSSKQSALHSRLNRGEDAKKARKQVIKMLLTAILLFLLCWGPKLILSFVWKLAIKLGYDQNFTPEWYLVRIIFHLIPFVHCCFNFFLYLYFTKSFRRSMQKKIYGCCSLFGCKCKCFQPSSRGAIPLRSTVRARLQGVDSVYSSNYCQISEGPSTRHTEIECVSAI